MMRSTSSHILKNFLYIYIGKQHLREEKGFSKNGITTNLLTPKIHSVAGRMIKSVRYGLVAGWFCSLNYSKKRFRRIF
jgi:hypothetical protein